MKRQPEFQLQKAVTRYLSVQYPDVLFLSDTIANVKLTMSQAIRNKSIQKENFKCPDIIILKPNSVYHGLLLELKVKSPFKSDGTLLKNDHLQGQYNTIVQLNKLKYFACFVVGFDSAKAIIDNYMKIN